MLEELADLFEKPMYKSVFVIEGVLHLYSYVKGHLQGHL